MARITDWQGITRGRYSYLVRVKVSPFPRQTKRFPLDTKLKTLQGWRDRTRQTLERSRPREDAPGSLASDIRRYLERWGAGKHPQTVEQRKRYLALWSDVFGDRLRVLITTDEIEGQLRLWREQGLPVSAHAKKRGHGGKPLTAATIRKVRQALFQVYAVLDRGTGLNPVAGVPSGTDPEPDPLGLSPVVVRAILAKLPRSRTKARAYVVAYTGLRPPHEVAAIEPGDVDVRGRRLFVRSGKGSTRTAMPLTRRAAAALRYFAWLDAWGQWTSAPANRMLKQAAVDAGFGAIKDAVTFYALRHSFATWHYAATGDIQATQAAMRHKSIRMTQRYTRAAVTVALQSSIDKLDAAQRKRHVR